MGRLGFPGEIPKCGRFLIVRLQLHSCLNKNSWGYSSKYESYRMRIWGGGGGDDDHSVSYNPKNAVTWFVYLIIRKTFRGVHLESPNSIPQHLWKDMPGCGEEAGGRSPFRDVASTFASWTLGKTKEQAQKFWCSYHKQSIFPWRFFVCCKYLRGYDPRMR